LPARDGGGPTKAVGHEEGECRRFPSASGRSTGHGSRRSIRFVRLGRERIGRPSHRCAHRRLPLRCACALLPRRWTTCPG